MKWREPWARSLKEQPPYNLLGRGPLREFVVWLLVFSVIFLVAALEDGSAPGLESRIWYVPALAAGLAAALYSIRWLSPRSIDSGPRGIVVTKADRHTLVPWSAIASFDVFREPEFNMLSLSLKSGSCFRIIVPKSIDTCAVEEEINEMVSKEP